MQEKEVVTKSYLDTVIAQMETRMTKQLYSVVGTAVIVNIAATAVILAVVRTF